MALPTRYLTTTKNLDAILAAIRKAQAPKQFTIAFLQTLGFASSSDRLVVGVLKALGFLTESGTPTKRYHEFLDESQSRAVMAEGIRSAYADLFQVNKDAHEMSVTEVKGKMKTLSEGQYSDNVIEDMAATFKALVRHADFKAREEAVMRPEPEAPAESDLTRSPEEPQRRIGSLVYSVNLILPESRDPSVYDALFRSLREHLLS